MKRTIVLSSLFVLAAAAATAAPAHRIAKVPMPLVVDIRDGEHRAVIQVAAPPQVPSVVPDDWTKGQIHNAIVFASMQRHGNPKWALWADHICYVDPRLPPTSPIEPEPVRIPVSPAPGWDDPGSPTLYCTCADPVYDSGKRLLGCMATGCGGCMICSTMKP